MFYSNGLICDGSISDTNICAKWTTFKNGSKENKDSNNYKIYFYELIYFMINKNQIHYNKKLK